MPAKPSSKDRRRGGPPRPLATLLSRMLKRSGLGRGFGAAGILTDWPAIVGAEMARHCLPEKLVHGRGMESGTLHLRVAGAWATELQHLEPIILERINGYFGYRAVAGLRVSQGPVPEPAPHTLPEPRPLDAAAERRLAAQLAGIQDESLRRALERLGRAVLGAGAGD